MESSSSGPSKKARAPFLGVQTVACLVDGCTADLSKCRDYHRRHKVCELHSKTPKVTIGGNEQRFCQQCSRFHSLAEFDEGKRSCRKRLDGHNRRRRKPQPETFSINSGSFLSSHQGTRYLSFGGSHLSPTCAMGRSSWASPVKAESETMLYNNHPQLNFFNKHASVPGSFSDNYREGKQHQYPFLQGANSAFHGASTLCQPFLDNKCSSINGQQKCSDGLSRVVDSDSRALSLLSSSLAETQETTGLSCCVTQAQPLMPGLNYQQRSLLVPDADINCQEMFQIGPDGPSSGGPHPRLSFSWD